MNKFHLHKWCDAATAKILYRGDRKAVRQELQQHMEDKWDALAAKGVPEEDIPEQILRSMGSAEELAPQLAAIHRPFWGYFHHFAKILLILVLPVFLFVLLWQGFRFATDNIYKEPDYSRSAYNPYTDTFASGMQRFHYAEPNLSFRDSGYSVKLTKVACWGGKAERLYFRLEVTSILPLCDHPDFCYYITMRDNLGNEYAPTYYSHGIDTNALVYRDIVQTGHFSWICDTRISNFDYQNIEWIELCYTRDGRNTVMRVPISGGDAA